jgi:signal transduction histidine kinase
MSDEIAALRQQLADAMRRAASLSRVVEAISGELALQPLLTRVVSSAVELLDAGYGSIGLVELHDDAPAVRVAAIYNMPERELGAVIPPGVGLAGRVLATREPIRLARYGDLDRPTLPELADHTVIGLPIWWRERLIGFFGIGAAPPRRFSDDDVATLALFARHAAIAIANARAFEAEHRRAARIAIVNRISRQITTSLNLDTIFAAAVRDIHGQLGLAYVAAGIVAPDDPETLVLLTHAGLHADKVPAGYRQSIHVGLVGAAARTRERILVNNTNEDPRYLQILGAPDIRATLVLPLVVGERVLGVLNIESERPIDDEEAEGVALIADQLSLAMDNVRRYDESRLLYETSRRMSTALDENAVVGTYLQYVAQQRRHACGLMLYRYDAEGRRSERELWGYWEPDKGLVRSATLLPYIPDATVPLLDAGQLVLIADAAEDPGVYSGFRQFMAQFRWRALAMIPLLVRGERIGIVWLTRATPYVWRDADLQPYQITAALLASAIDHRRQALLFAEQGRQLAVLDERRRLARELHDSVTQSLFSISLLSQALPGLWELDQGAARESLTQVRDLTRTALTEMRALLFELRPAALAENDLVQALREHVAAFEERTGISVTFMASGEFALPPQVEQALFRVAQEALANVARHSGARSVTLELRAGPPLRLRIADDGHGFAAERVGEGHFGLVSMRERAAAIGAQLEVLSAPERGTEIVINWPSA